MDPSTQILLLALGSFIAFIFGCLVGTTLARASSASTIFRASSGGLSAIDLRRLESKVDLLLRHFDLTSQADAAVKQIAQQHGVPPEILALLPHNKIEAIKLMRTMSGLGLKEAKDKVDAACREIGR